MRKWRYISLVNCLCGYCIAVRADNEAEVRQWAADNLGKLWFTVYDEKPDCMELIGTPMEI